MRLQNQARDYAIAKGDNASTTMQSSAQKASLDLLSFGIPGLRYLDGNSRNPFPFDAGVRQEWRTAEVREGTLARRRRRMVADAKWLGNTAKVIERPVEAGSNNMSSGTRPRSVTCGRSTSRSPPTCSTGPVATHPPCQGRRHVNQLHRRR